MTLATLLSLLKVAKERSDQVQAEGTLSTLRRYRILAATTVVANLAYVGFFLTRDATATLAIEAHWVQAVIWTHGLTALVALPLGLIIHRFCQRTSQDPGTASVLQIVFCLVGLSFAIALSVIDQMVSATTTNYASILLVLAMLSLMRPRRALVLYTLAYACFFLLVPLTQHDTNLLSIARSHAASSTVLSLIASTLVWHQYVHSVLLRRELKNANTVLAEKQAELAILATRDSLTGLYVRREFNRLTEMELARAARMGMHTSLIMVDLDHFKQINDHYGHPAGDEVLKQVAHLLTQSVRNTDIVARMGGEEFIILLPDTNPIDARGVAEKLRLAIRAKPLLVLDHALPVTASLGISSATGAAATQATDYAALYAIADQALYRAKQQGRDRVV